MSKREYFDFDEPCMPLTQDDMLKEIFDELEAKEKALRQEKTDLWSFISHKAIQKEFLDYQKELREKENKNAN
jgi:hypothetical protein